MKSKARWFVLDVNPEPWRIGPVGAARSKTTGHVKGYVGRDEQLDSYKKAVRGAIGETTMVEGRFVLTFLFWRNLATYLVPTQRGTKKYKDVTKHEVDVTNMQKATEDALQGVLFKNDNKTHEVHSYLVEQGTAVRGRVAIGIEPITYALPDILESLPEDVYLKLQEPDDHRLQLDMFNQTNEHFAGSASIF